MKLPGITYQLGVQSLGREDVNAPARQWAADQQVREADQKMLDTAVELFTAAEEQIGKNEATRAINEYNEQKQAWYNEQQYYDANGKPRTELQKDFEEFDAQARSNAMSSIRTSSGEMMFTAQADRLNVQYQDQWQKQSIAWVKEDQLANSTKAYNDSLVRGDYGAAYYQIDEAQTNGLISPVKAEEMRLKTQTHQVETNTFNSIQAVSNLQEANNVRRKIENTQLLSPERKEQYLNMLDNQMIDVATNEARTMLSDAYAVAGPQGASDLATAMALQAKLWKSSADDGVRDSARPKMINAIERVAADFVIKAQNNRARAERIFHIEQAAEGKYQPGERDSVDRRAWNDYLTWQLGGQLDDDNKWVPDSVPTSVEILSPEGAPYRDVLVNSFDVTGTMLDKVKETIDSGLTSQNVEHRVAAVQMLKDMQTSTAGAASFDKLGLQQHEMDIILAFDADQATILLTEAKKNSRLEKKYDDAAFAAQKKSDEDFKSYMKAEFPQVGMIWDSAPEYQAQFQAMVEDKAKKLIPLVGGNVDAAYRAAADSVSRNYGVDQINGKMVTKPFATSVPYGGVDNGQWVHDQLKSDLKDYLGYEVSDYTYHPVDGFDSEHPAYVVSWFDDTGRYQAATYEPDFDSTETGYKFRKATQANKDESNRVSKNTREIEEVRSTHGNFEALPWASRMQYLSDKLQEDATSFIKWITPNGPVSSVSKEKWAELENQKELEAQANGN